MNDAAPPYGLKLENIPRINLRMHFDHLHDFVSSPEAEAPLPKPGNLPSALTWDGTGNEFFTMALQRSLLGLEAYLAVSLGHVAALLNSATPDLLAKLRSPSKFPGQMLASKLYHVAPSAVNRELSLQVHDGKLFVRTQDFYKRIRNPLFHGHQLKNPPIDGIRAAFDHIAALYGWIDHWMPPEDVHRGGTIVVGPLRLNIGTFKNRAPAAKAQRGVAKK